MLLSADALVVSPERVLPAGALRVEGRRIVEVGERETLARRHPHDELRAFPGCVLAPGLVNAHTHLCLTALRAIKPAGDLPGWIARITRAVLALEPADFADSAALGAAESLLAGVTSVGDIVYGAEPVRSASGLGLGGVFFHEVLGIAPDALEDALVHGGVPLASAACEPEPAAGVPRTARGISPHAPYSCGPDLLRASAALAGRLGLPRAVHVAESPAERELLHEGTGPLAANAARLAHGFVAPGTGTVAYLDALDALRDVIAIHCVQLEPGEAALLARTAAGAVLCPRSNLLLGNGAPPVRALRDAGVRLALGTDSAASNADLDVLAEARLLRTLDPSLDAREAWRLLTTGAATVLGIIAGTLTPGADADLVAFAPTSDDAGPFEALLSPQAPGVRAVMTAGAWRVLDGGPRFELRALQEKAARVAEKARRAADGS